MSDCNICSSYKSVGSSLKTVERMIWRSIAMLKTSLAAPSYFSKSKQKKERIKSRPKLSFSVRLFSFCWKFESLRLMDNKFFPFWLFEICLRLSEVWYLSPEESLSRWSLLESSVAWVTDIDIDIAHVDVDVTHFDIDIDVAHIDIYWCHGYW